MRFHGTCVLTGVLLLCIFAGCNQTGPRMVATGRPRYNQAVQRTDAEQMLLNVVRLKYRDTPFFLQVASISANFEFEGSADASVNLPNNGSAIWDLAVGGRVLESPTVTYTPLQGEQFVRQLMSPIDLDTVLLLYHSGWSIDRIFRVCVQELNGVPNAPTAAGPTPDNAPTYETFQEATRLLRSLQRRGDLELGSADDEQGGLNLRLKPEALKSLEWQRLAAILSLPSERNSFHITMGVGRVREEGEIRLITRSLVSALFYLSHGVAVPPEDEAAGRVTLTRQASGEPFDWHKLTGDLLRVQVSREPPDNFAVRTRYRNTWFYIDDSDLPSKSTFTMLGQLFQLQGGDVPTTAPLLTLPVSR